MAGITTRLDAEEREKILLARFSPTYVTTYKERFQPYIRHYQNEIAKLSSGVLQAQFQLCVSSHEQLSSLLNLIATHAATSKTDLCTLIRDGGYAGDDTVIFRSIDLAVRTWLMINVREPGVDSYIGPCLDWHHDQTLSELMETTFPVSRWKLEAKDSRLHPSFTAAFMMDVCGLKLSWTDTLSDHLLLDRMRNTLYVFPHKFFLAGQLLPPSANTSHTTYSPLTQQLLKETIWTLNLLFPPWQSATKDVLNLQEQDIHCVGPYDGPRTSNLMEFEHWRDRISELYDVVFLAPPVSWKQLWRDRRNPQQFWTFWIALFILVLTLISTAASVIQTWASVSSRG